MSLKSKSLLFNKDSEPPEGQIHFITSGTFENINFFQRSGIDNFSNLKVYINGELTDQTANNISFNANDDIIIKATRGKYPYFGGYYDGNSYHTINYIKSIEEPLPLMHNYDNTLITNVSCCFYNCFSLINIPKGLFDNNPSIINFNACFSRCMNLSNIPEGLFDNNPNATIFSGCFTETAIRAIPEGLFDNNIHATNFDYCFMYCSTLVAIPINLFDKNINAFEFTSCFKLCNKTIVNVQIGSMASSVSSVNVMDFASGTNAKGNVYCHAGTAVYTAFQNSTNANVNVLTY